jgi:hypothetical protein
MTFILSRNNTRVPLNNLGLKHNKKNHINGWIFLKVVLLYFEKSQGEHNSSDFEKKCAPLVAKF